MMYYNEMYIKYSPSLCKLLLHINKTPYSRESTKGSLIPGLGVYHYSRDKKPDIAFKELKEAMIKVRQEILFNIAKEIKDLSELTYENAIKAD